MTRVIDVAGQTFGRLTVIWPVGITVERRALWLCVCSCGKLAIVAGTSMRRGGTSSCGCLRTEMNVIKIKKFHGGIHGHAKRGKISPEFNSWSGAKDRCFNKNNHAYARYGGRGITMCERWKNSFSAFLEDVGIKPSAEYSIDRWPNNDGNYEPGNCRWATKSQQVHNRRKFKPRKNGKETKNKNSFVPIQLPCNQIQRHTP